jgi:hypothetical protein
VANVASCWMPWMFATRQCAPRAEVAVLWAAAVRTGPPLALRSVSPGELELSDIPIYNQSPKVVRR